MNRIFESNKYLRLFKKYWKALFLVLIGSCIYIIIHELVHLYFVNLFGYSGKISINIISKVRYFTPLNNVPKIHHLIITLAPHVLSSLILFSLLIISFFKKSKLFLWIGAIPLLDVEVNFLSSPFCFYLGLSNDFSNLIKRGFLYWPILIGIIPFLIYYILWKTLNNE